jgi:hypothetical protein
VGRVFRYEGGIREINGRRGCYWQGFLFRLQPQSVRVGSVIKGDCGWLHAGDYDVGLIWGVLRAGQIILGIERANDLRRGAYPPHAKGSHDYPRLFHSVPTKP